MPILQGFAEQVRQHPEAIALSSNGEVMTYLELNERANQLAHHLRALGLQCGEPVALCVERSTDLVTGILGILKAGGAYVPLDPDYPADRLEFMLKDSGANLVVMHPPTASRLESQKTRLVSLSPQNEELRRGSKLDPKICISPDQLAYIIYTSGSTGTPKGVMIRHSNLAISTAARLEYYQEPVGNYLLLSSFSFDSSIAGIFWALASGGTLTLPMEGAHQDPGAIRRLVRDGKITHLLALPAFYRAILEGGTPEDFASLTTAIVAGEPCRASLVTLHYAKVPGGQIV